RDGRCVFRGLPAGEYSRLELGFDDRIAVDPIRFELVAGRALELPKLRGLAPRSARGVVVDETGAAVAHATVQVVLPPHVPLAPAAHTPAAQGAFTTAPPPPPPWSLNVTADGFVSVEAASVEPAPDGLVHLVLPHRKSPDR